MIHDGELFVMGRLSDLIIRRGRNSHPHDIEALAESVEPLLIPHAAAAFELPSGAGEPVLGLVAESKCMDGVKLNEAIATVRSTVAEELELPLAVVAICERGMVPKTTSGKVQRRLCRALLEAGELQITCQWRSPALSSTI